MALKLIPPGEGEVVGNSPTRRVEILSDDDPVHVTVSRYGPGQEGADLHVHHRHSDFFYVLEGELTVRLGLEDSQLTVPAGSLARVPPDVVHGFRNASGAALRFLNFHAPGCDFATYMRGLRDGVKVVYDQHDPPADGGRPISEAEVANGDVLTEIDGLRITRVPVDGVLHGPAVGYVLEGDAAGSWVELADGEEFALDGVLLRVET
jgi:mannose-6-phosphate isomerase-like protein (cupin superfamily)